MSTVAPSSRTTSPDRITVGEPKHYSYPKDSSPKKRFVLNMPPIPEHPPDRTHRNEEAEAMRTPPPLGLPVAQSGSPTKSRSESLRIYGWPVASPASPESPTSSPQLSPHRILAPSLSNHDQGYEIGFNTRTYEPLRRPLALDPDLFAIQEEEEFEARIPRKMPKQGASAQSSRGAHSR